MNIAHQNDKLLIAAVTLIMCLVGIDVACKSAPPASTPTDTGNLVACVETQLIAGNTNIVDIAAKCGGAEIAVVTDIVDTLLKAQSAPTFAIKRVLDGGTTLDQLNESH